MTNVLWHSCGIFDHIISIIWLFFFFCLKQKLSFGARSANWTLNEAPGFEIHNKNTELDARDFRQFAIHSPPTAQYNALYNAIHLELGQKKRTPTHVNQPVQWGVLGRRQVSWRVEIIWLVMWYTATGREEATMSFEDRKWSTSLLMSLKKENTHLNGVLLEW